MKEMIKRVREREEGFTLAELLIVVAIIAVLVAIAIPVFSSQLDKAQASTDAANCRSLYGELTTLYLTEKDTTTTKYNNSTGIGELINNAKDEITFPDGPTYKLQKGTCDITFDADKGFTVLYICDGNYVDGGTAVAGKYVLSWGGPVPATLP